MKKIAFVFIFCFCLFFILEIVSYNFLYGFLRGKTPLLTTELSTNYKLYGLRAPDILDFEIILPNRNDETLTYDKRKKPILTIGCSYTYGHGISINKTFASQLQKKTHRKVWNVAEMGAGPNNYIKALAYMEKHHIMQDNQFEYVIYTLMYDHVYRMLDLGMISLYTFENCKKNKNNSFKDRLKYYLNMSYTVRMFYSKRYAESRNFEWSFNHLKYRISQMNEIIKRTLPNSTFIVLLYDDVTNTSKDSPIYGLKEALIPLDKNSYPEQAAEGVKFISTKELVGDILYKEEYQIKYDTFQYWSPHHPNEKAWEIIVPQLCKKFNF